MNNDNEYLFFWGKGNNFVFSNFFPINDNLADTSEKQFMLLKAAYFNDAETIQKIYRSESPKEAKLLGRGVKNFDEAKWDEVKELMMLEALRYKVDNSFQFRHKLIESHPKILVEASPYDRIWGIGYGENEALHRINDWGENLLGKCLMNLREELIKREKAHKEAHSKIFNGQKVYISEYGAGAYIRWLDSNEIMADFTSHLDAERFMELLDAGPKV